MSFPLVVTESHPDGVLGWLEKAFEALRPKPPVVDNKTAFWNAYRTVADEYDKEFQQKYSTDLDTTLIFAGLFSAVSSAFIIQIQPELQPDPNDMTHALLRLLIHNVNGTIFSSPDIPQWSGPPRVIVIIQCLLYTSLASTLMAALLAVLGKQWLMYYGAAGERGNIEQRCLERQRKFDGMRRWRFDPVMQMFPLLLQFSLLFFAAALAIYLWTINHSVAAVVLSLSALGLGIYISLGMSAVVSPDSPFRNPLTDYWITAISRVRLVLGSILQRVSLVLQPILARVIRYRERHLFSRIAKVKRRLLKFYSSKMKASQIAEDKIPILGDRYSPPDPSPSLPAVLWVLDTSTDPELVNAAAGMVEELQWPEVLDVTSPMNRLLDIFIACFDKEKGWKIRDGALERAIRCGRAYLVLRLVHQSWKRQDLDHDRDNNFSFWALKTDNQELSDIRLLALSLNARVLYRAISPPSQKLVLQIFPTLISQHDGYNPAQDLVEEIDGFLDHANQRMDLNEDSSLFADYLFCLNCFFDQANSDEIACIDKCEYQGLLITRLFHNLLRCAMPQHTIVKIVKTTVRLASKVENNERTFGAQDAINRRIAIYAFCAQPAQGSVSGIPAVLSAINLARDSMDIASAITEFRPSISLMGPVLHGDIFWGQQVKLNLGIGAGIGV
ncbi:hypothetical protein MVEN_01853100 [Mycena venus]|uniref:DUF6535 domain-containing protein n=1 Tax=Mycena venus TaxID=2733690 RepID=A0A8H6XIK7_9AGAR|nr:hypothetical protein MVEN_01853100 [Mycena venus]